MSPCQRLLYQVTVFLTQIVKSKTHYILDEYNTSGIFLYQILVIGDFYDRPSNFILIDIV